MKQKQLHKRWENAKPIELENDSNGINDYDITYYNYDNQFIVIKTNWNDFRSI